MLSQDWFELQDIRKRNFSKSVWIPLRAFKYIIREGKCEFEGYKEDFFGTGSIAIPTDNIDKAKNLGWTDIGIIRQHCGYVENGVYVPAEVYLDYRGEVEATHLVLEQASHDASPHTWHLNQDLVLSLGLKREGNSWLRPTDGYVEVARLTETDEGRPVVLEIKAQYLKDYLCARGMALYMTHYYHREQVVADVSRITWTDGVSSEKNETDLWEGRIMPIHEGGGSFGTKMAVIHVARTDVDESDDVPDISAMATDQNTKGESWERDFQGRKLFRVHGELWRNEIIDPGKQSPIVRGDDIPNNVYFIIDAEATRVCGKELIESGKWLWFKPELIVALYHRRGGSLCFCTAQTGMVSCSYGYDIHFGVNELGLVNVFAKDVGRLPEWQQQIWVGHNIPPEGGVCSELLASQVRAEPADTLAPEEFLGEAIQTANTLANEKFRIKIFREHAEMPELLAKAHRFRSFDKASFYSLAKDLARIIVDSLDAAAMQSVVPPPKGSKWGSLKSLENLLASGANPDFIRKIISPLVGVYELRHADAHLPSSQIENAFDLINVNRSAPFVHQGYQLLCEVLNSLHGVIERLRRWPSGVVSSDA